MNKRLLLILGLLIYIFVFPQRAKAKSLQPNFLTIEKTNITLDKISNNVQNIK